MAAASSARLACASARRIRGKRWKPRAASPSPDLPIGSRRVRRERRLGFGELGYNLALGRSAIEPFAGFAYVNVDGSPFSELGGAAALTGSSSFDASFATLGVRGSTPLMSSDRMQLGLRGGIGWRRALGDVTPDAALAFTAGGAPFTVAGAPIAKNSLAVEAGIDLDVAANAKLSVLYDGQLSADGSSNGVKLNFSLRF